MNIIKEYTDNHAIIRTTTYAHSLLHFQELFDIAKKDFPNLDSKDVSITKYAGKRYKGTFGIEFTCPLFVKIPDDYVEIDHLEDVQ